MVNIECGDISTVSLKIKSPWFQLISSSRYAKLTALNKKILVSPAGVRLTDQTSVQPTRTTNKVNPVILLTIYYIMSA